MRHILALSLVSLMTSLFAVVSFTQPLAAVVLQKLSEGIKILNRSSTYAAILKRFDSNLACHSMAPLPTLSTCPFRRYTNCHQCGSSCRAARW